MRFNKKQHQHTLNTILYLAATMGPIVIIGLMLGVKLSSPTIWLWTLAYQGISGLLFFYPISLYLFMSLFIVAFIFIQRLSPELIIKFGQVVSSYSINTQNYLAGYDVLTPLNSHITWALLSIIILITIHFILKKTRAILATGACLIIYMIYAWYLHIDSAYYYIALSTSAFALLYSFQNFNKLSHNEEVIKLRGNLSQLSLWRYMSFRYILLIVILALLLPKHPALLRWSQVEETISERFPFINSLRKDMENTRTFSAAETFDFSSTGFVGDSGILGGPVSLNEEIAFTVKSPYPLYLRGNILSQYDGKSWQTGQDVKTEKKTGHPLRPEHLSGEEVTLTVTYKNFSSFTLFAPYQPIEVLIERSGKLWTDLDHQLTLLGARYKNDSYTITSFIPSRKQENFSVPASIMFNKEGYLDLPDTLPLRVGDLAKDLTKGCDTDLEKAQVISTYLSSQYTYSLDAERPPLGHDFVDYFLFESKEGYCTYHASSLAVMLRTLNIPTRYVEGFLMPPEHKNGLYQVRFANGHAWTEVYIDGIGWMTFEATPSFDGHRTASDITSLTLNEDIDLYSIEDEAAYLLALKQEQNSQEKDLDTHDQSLIKTAFTETMKTKFLKVLPILLVLLLVGILPARALFLHIRIKKYRKALVNKEDRVLYLYQNILDLMEHIGDYRDLGETTLEYSRRIKSHLYDSTHDFQALTLKVSNYKYGGYGDTDLLYQELNEFFTFAERRIYYKMGRLKFLRTKYIRGTLYQRL